MLRAAALFEAARPWAHKQPQIGDFREIKLDSGLD